jgi:hypothetical protein
VDWKCYIENYALQDGAISLNVVFVNEARGIKMPRNIRTTTTGIEDLKSILRGEIDRLGSVDVVKDVPPGLFDLTPAAPIPDEKEAAWFGFQAAVRLWRTIRQQADDGFATAEDAASAHAAALALWLPEYLGRQYY